MLTFYTFPLNIKMTLSCLKFELLYSFILLEFFLFMIVCMPPILIILIIFIAISFSGLDQILWPNYSGNFQTCKFWKWVLTLFEIYIQFCICNMFMLLNNLFIGKILETKKLVSSCAYNDSPNVSLQCFWPNCSGYPWKCFNMGFYMGSLCLNTLWLFLL